MEKSKLSKVEHQRENEHVSPEALVIEPCYEADFIKGPLSLWKLQIPSVERKGKINHQVIL